MASRQPERTERGHQFGPLVGRRFDPHAGTDEVAADDGIVEPGGGKVGAAHPEQRVEASVVAA